MDKTKSISVNDLKEKCQEQTQLFYKQKKHTTEFCYELFRRFFEEDNQASLSAIYLIYKPQVMNWVKSHKYFHQIIAEEEEIVIDSLSHFVFALRRHPFSNFATIAAIMAYWRICVHSVIALQWRKAQRQQVLQQAQTKVQEEIFFEDDILKSNIWKRIEETLSDEKDQLLARLVFVYNMKPRHIAEDYSNIWEDTNSVRVAQQRIKRKLQKDKTLHELLKGLEL